MGKIGRSLNKNKYNISKHRYYELYYYSLQYEEWKNYLKNTINSVKSPQTTDMPRVRKISDSTYDIAVSRAEIADKIYQVEQAAMMADSELYQYILAAVTNEGITYNYLREKMKMPACKNKYYESRRRYYYFLDQIKKR